MSKNNGALTPRQHAAIEALLSARDVKEAAQLANVGYKTLRGWLDSDSAFNAAYRAARRSATQQAIARLQNYSSAAVAVILQLMAAPTTPAHVRLAAASKLLDLVLKVTEIEDIQQRLEALEEAHAQRL